MRQTLLLITLITALHGTIASAWSDNETHQAAHFGVSYAMNSFIYGLAGHDGLGMSRTEALVFATAVSMMIGFIPEYFEAMETRHLDGRALGFNALGNAAAVGTTLLFRF